jgi:hypothetical protein
MKTQVSESASASDDDHGRCGHENASASENGSER